MKYNPYEEARRTERLNSLQKENDALKLELKEAKTIMRHQKLEITGLRLALGVVELIRQDNEDLRVRLIAIQDFVNAKNTH